MKESIINDIFKFKIINRLKSVYRLNSVDNRHENTAEHTWSALVLADYYMNKYSLGVDREKVFELLIYHDLQEIYSGDFPLSPRKEHRGKKSLQQEHELSAEKKLSSELPQTLKEKYHAAFVEFSEQKTRESKFAKCIDSFDSVIHELDYKSDWRGYTKNFLIEKKEAYFLDFPDILGEFHAVLDWMERNEYFGE